MADDNEPDGTHSPAGPPDAVDSQIRAAAHALIEQYARSVEQTTSGVPSEPIGEPGSTRTPPRPSRRFGTVTVGLTAAAAVIALVLVLLNGIDGTNDEDEVVTVEPAQGVPDPGPTLLITLGSDMGYGQPAGTTAVLLEADSGKELGEIRLPTMFFKGGLGGTTLDAVALVQGELEFLYSTHTDVIDIVARGTVDEATDMRAALWKGDRLTADRLSYFMQLGPDGTVLTADRGHPAGFTNTRSEDSSGFNTVIDQLWTVTTDSGGDTRSFTWDDGPLPLEDIQVFTSDGSAVVNLHGLTRDRAGSIEVTTLALGDSCSACPADGRSFDVMPVELGFGLLGAGFLDDTTIWFEWADRSPVDDANPFAYNPYGRASGLGTLDLLSGETATVPLPADVTVPGSTLRPISSVTDDALFLQQTVLMHGNSEEGYESEELGALWRWNGSAWTAVELPAAPDGLGYQDVYVLPGVPESLGDPGSERDEAWCDRNLDGPVPELPELGQVVLEVSGSERQVSRIDGLSEVVETMTADFGYATPYVWLQDCTIAVQLSDYTWDRLLLRFARTDDGRFALTGEDRWMKGPS